MSGREGLVGQNQRAWRCYDTYATLRRARAHKCFARRVVALGDREGAQDRDVFSIKTTPSFPRKHFLFVSLLSAAALLLNTEDNNVADIFEEGNQIDQNDQKKLPEFSDVYGLMTYHGVPKPGWRAFALMHSQ